MLQVRDRQHRSNSAGELSDPGLVATVVMPARPARIEQADRTEGATPPHEWHGQVRGWLQAAQEATLGLREVRTIQEPLKP